LLCAPLEAQEQKKPASEDNKAKAELSEKKAKAEAETAEQAEKRAKAEQAETPAHAYRIDFSIIELEDSKKINSRHYSMDLNSGDRNQIKIGTRVPVATGSFDPSKGPTQFTQFQYIDVGTSINCRLEERGNELAVDVRGEFSNFSNSNDQHGPQSAVAWQPIVRQININGSTLASPGKPIVIGSVDDPNSNREFQLEVTATRLK
jgi:hypothetical protein